MTARVFGSLVLAASLLVPVALLSQGQTTNPAAPQARPNFTGTWTLVHRSPDPRMRLLTGPSYLVGDGLVIAQTDASISFTQSLPGVGPKIDIPSDGRATVLQLPNPNTALPYKTFSFTARAVWERGSLVITTAPGPLTDASQGPGWEVASRWSLTPAGQLLILNLQPDHEVAGGGVTTDLFVRR